MIDINKLIDDVIRREAGYVNHPNDRGGPTKYGITLKTLAKFRGVDVTAADVENLSIEEAFLIDKFEYYLKPKIDLLPESIQPFILDSSIHHGPVRAIKFLQKTCNSTLTTPIKEDGVIGPKTLKAVDETLIYRKFEYFMEDMIILRRNFCKKIVVNDPTQAVFLDGWMNRIDEFE